MRGALQPHPKLLVITHVEHTYTVTVDQATEAILEAPRDYSSFSGPSFANTRYIGGPEGILVVFRAQFCEYAMRGALQPHPSLLEVKPIEKTYTVTVDKATAAIL
jgi:hypothetical protein